MTSLERVGRHHPDETGVIMSFLSSQDIARLMQAQHKSLAKECLAANVRTLPDHMLVPCERYSKHAGNAELLHRVRTERDRRAEVHTPGFMATKASIAKRRIDREVDKWVDKLLWWPRWRKQHADLVFQMYLNPIDFEAFRTRQLGLHGNRIVPYYVAEALRKMFVMENRRDLLPLIPYLKIDPSWAELAALLVGRRMDASIAKWVRFLESRRRELEKMFAASSDAEKLLLARSLTSHDDMRLLCDIKMYPQPWMMRAPNIVRCMMKPTWLWPSWSREDIATFASWLLINPETHARDGENPSGLPALQAENVAAFEAILRHRPEVARSDRIASAVHALQSNVALAGAQRALLQRVIRAVGSTRAAGSG